MKMSDSDCSPSGDISEEKLREIRDFLEDYKAQYDALPETICIRVNGKLRDITVVSVLGDDGE